MPTIARSALCCSGLSVLAAFSPVAAQPAPTDAAQSLLNAEDALFAADVHHDVAAIRQGFADEAVFVHANGMIQTKADYLQAVGEAKFPIKSIAATARTVKIVGDVGIVRGTKNLIVGDGLHLASTYLTVYIRRDARWQLLDEQSSPAPKSPAA